MQEPADAAPAEMAKKVTEAAVREYSLFARMLGEYMMYTASGTWPAHPAALSQPPRPSAQHAAQTFPGLSAAPKRFPSLPRAPERSLTHPACCPRHKPAECALQALCLYTSFPDSALASLQSGWWTRLRRGPSKTSPE